MEDGAPRRKTADWKSTKEFGMGQPPCVNPMSARFRLQNKFINGRKKSFASEINGCPFNWNTDEDVLTV